MFQAYHKLAKEFHPDKNPQHGEKVLPLLMHFEDDAMIHFYSSKKSVLHTKYSPILGKDNCMINAEWKV